MDEAQVCLEKGDVTVGGIRFHIVKKDIFINENGVINVVIGVQVTDEMQRAMLSGCRVFLIHDQLMLSQLIKNQSNARGVKEHFERVKEVDLVKWMTRGNEPISIGKSYTKYNDLLELIDSENCPKHIQEFLDHDSYIQ